MNSWCWSATSRGRPGHDRGRPHPRCPGRALRVRRPPLRGHAQHRHRAVSEGWIRHRGSAGQGRHGHVQGQGPGSQRPRLLRRVDGDPLAEPPGAGKRPAARLRCGRLPHLTTNPRSTWRRAAWWASRPCCAGAMPRAAGFPRTSFIPVAEETGLIVAMGSWVLRETCLQLQRWAGRISAHLSIAVNVSVQQFAREDFVESVLRTLAGLQRPAAAAGTRDHREPAAAQRR